MEFNKLSNSELKEAAVAMIEDRIFLLGKSQLAETNYRESMQTYHAISQAFSIVENKLKRINKELEKRGLVIDGESD